MNETEPTESTVTREQIEHIRCPLCRADARRAASQGNAVDQAWRELVPAGVRRDLAIRQAQRELED